MKKTIIAIIALLSGTAVAQDSAFSLEDAICTNGATSIQLDSSLGNTVAVSLLLDTKAIGSALESPNNLFSIDNLSYSLKRDNNESLEVSTNKFSLNWTDAKLSSPATTPIPTLNDFADADKASLTFIIGYNMSPIPSMNWYTGHIGVLTVEKEGNTSTYYLNNTAEVKLAGISNFSINGEYVQEGWISAAPSNFPSGSTVTKYFIPMAEAASKEALAHQVIPEPTTATLSLLALAGLAARRRRR